MPAERQGGWPKKVLVTGASSGIGLALTRRLLAAGSIVIGIGRDLAKADLDGERFHPVQMDLADLDALPTQLQDLARQNADLNAIVSNAGSGTLGSLEEHSYPTIRQALDLNLTSHVYIARAFLPILKRQGGGKLVFIGSESGLRGSRGGSLYCAAKFGLRGLAQSLRDECSKSGVAVSLVNPGMVRTPFFDGLPIRPGEAEENALQPEEVADGITWILRQRPGVVIDEINLTPLNKAVQRGKGVGSPPL
jgi:NADP-dependent 3-hydroxy acid dehydrogenase YdfG